MARLAHGGRREIDLRILRSRGARRRRDVCADEMAAQFIAARDRNAGYRMCYSRYRRVMNPSLLAPVPCAAFFFFSTPLRNSPSLYPRSNINTTTRYLMRWLQRVLRGI